MNQAVLDIKLKVHNAKQDVESLRKRRKHTHGKLNTLRSEAEQTESSLKLIDAKLEDAKALLRGLRAGYEIVKRKGSLWPRSR